MNANVNKPPSEMSDEELRLEIAEIVAKQEGWTIKEVPAAGEGIFAFINGDGQLEGFPPNWLKDPAAALGLLDSSWRVKIYRNENDNRWFADIKAPSKTPPGGMELFMGAADNSPARAISEAFVLVRRAA